MDKLEQPKKLRRAEVIKMLDSNNHEEICDALISITYYDEDWLWCQNQCLKFLNHSNKNVSGLAATCLGHMARIHKKLDKKLVINELKKHLDNISISGQIQDALDDIETFL